MISNLSYDEQNNRLMFDVTRNHFRDVAYLSFQDSVIGYLFENKEWDGMGWDGMGWYSIV